MEVFSNIFIKREHWFRVSLIWYITEYSAIVKRITTLMAESEEELKSLLMMVKESKKAGLKLNIQKTKIVASGPIMSWQIDGETVETVSDFIFLGSKITAVGDRSHEIKRCLLLGRKVILHNSVYMPILIFQFIRAPFPHTVSKHPLYVASPFLSCWHVPFF